MFFREYVTKRITRSPLWSTARRLQLNLFGKCAICGSVKKLEVHHKKPFKLFPWLELEPDNLVTLCSR